MPLTPQRSPVPKPSASRRAASSTHAAEARNVRPRSDYSDDLPEYGTSGMERSARQSKQATYAAATLKGKAETGVLTKPFIESIRQDLKKYSIVSENSFLVEFFRERETKDIHYPTREMETYTFEEVMGNALQEFKLELWVPVRRTSVDWTQFSVAVLFLIAESSTYFCWTAELFRRADKKHRETELMNAQQTYIFSHMVEHW